MKKRSLNIAIFHLAFFYSGGGEKLVLREIEGLKKRGHKVTCFTPTIDKKLCFPDIIGSFNIKTLFPSLPSFLPHKESIEILFSCLFFPLLAGKFRKYDVILGANQPGPWLAWLTKKISGVPYVIYLAQPTRILYPREVDKKEGLWLKQQSYIFPLFVNMAKPFIMWSDKVSIREAKTMLTNGDYIGGVLSKTYKRDYVSCPAGADLVSEKKTNRFKGEINIGKTKVRKPYILITNRHFPQKKFHYAVDAMPDILRKIPEVSLVITGNRTGYTKRLAEFVTKKKLDSKVIFTGFVKGKELDNLYANASVYVYTPPEEDFGMGVIEAMAAGVPVIAWNKGGPSTTIIDGKTGFLIKPYKEKVFKEKIIYLLKNKKINEQMGKEARKHAMTNFTYKKHLDILERALFSAV